MARYPLARWVPSGNTGGPRGAQTDRFVVHVTQGAFAGACSWLCNPTSEVSSHFVISRGGAVVQLVDTEVIAWHCAQWNPTSIGIEHEGISGQRLTPRQLHASLRLIQWLHEVYPQVPRAFTNKVAAKGVIGHGRLPEGPLSHPDCPGFPILQQFARYYAISARETP